MKKIFKFSKSKEISELTIPLDESFEFSESTYGWEFPVPAKNYICVVQEASKHKDILDKLREIQEVNVYDLPYDIAIIGLSGVNFKETPPKLIPLDALNDKLREVRENVVIVEMYDSFILTVKKLSYINGEDDIEVFCIDNKDRWEEYICYKSMIYSCKMRLSELNKNDQYDDTYNMILTGEEAETLWNRFLGDIIEKIK